MKKMYAWNWLVVLVFLFYCVGGVLFIASPVSAADVNEIIMSHCDRETSNMHIGYVAAKEFLESTGRFKITLYANGALSASEADALQQAADDEIQMTQSPVFVLANASQVTGYFVYDYPYFIETEENYTKISASEMAAEWAGQVLEKMNIRVGQAWYNGPMTIGAKKSIKSPKDLEGLKLRATPSIIAVDYLNRLGANPVAMLTAEVYTALQQGTVDGVYSPLHVHAIFKYDEVCNYYYRDASTTAMQIPVFSNTYYQKLSESDQKLIDEALKIFMETAKAEAAKLTVETKQYLLDKGADFVEVTEEQKEILREVGKEVRKNKADVAGQKYIDWTIKILGLTD